MSKIRSVLFGAAALALTQVAIADSGIPPEYGIQISRCTLGEECTGDSCVTIKGSSSDMLKKYGVTGLDANNQPKLICGAMLGGYSFKFPKNVALKFGVYFDADTLVICDNGGVATADSDMTLAYTISTNPNACSVKRK